MSKELIPSGRGPTQLEGGRRSRLFRNNENGIGAFAATSMKSVAGFMVDAVKMDDWKGSSPVIASKYDGRCFAGIFSSAVQRLYRLFDFDCRH